MHNLQKRFINRFVARVYLITKSDWLRLQLMRLLTKLFIDKHNDIEYDKTNRIYWHKKRNEYLPPDANPHFYFKVNSMEKRIFDIICHKYIPKKGDLVIDIGAGIGTELLFYRTKIESQGRLYSIEASPESFKKLELLTQKFNFKNCYNFNIAISDHNGEMWIEETDNYLKNKTNKAARGTGVLCFSLDQFINDNQIEKIDFLKVNIEGAEYEMIDGMKNSISIIDNLAISCHDFLSGKGDEEIRNKVVDFLGKNNFEMFFRNTGNKVWDSWIYGKRKKSISKLETY